VERAVTDALQVVVHHSEGGLLMLKLRAPPWYWFFISAQPKDKKGIQQNMRTENWT
jgi:hypothetical protein